MSFGDYFHFFLRLFVSILVISLLYLFVSTLLFRKIESLFGQSDNGSKGVAYQVIVDNMEDTETVKVSEDVYNSVVDGGFYAFCTNINTSCQCKKVRVISILCPLPDGGITPGQLKFFIETAVNDKDQHLKSLGFLQKTRH